MSSSQEQTTLLNLIAYIYDAALDENLWTGVAPQISRAFNAHSTAVQLRDTKSGAIELLSITDNYDPKSLIRYQSYYGARDIWVQRATDIGLSTIVSSHDMVADDEFQRSEFYNDWCRENGDLFYIVGAMFPVIDGQVSGIGIHRGPKAGAFQALDKQSVAKFLPHLQRALQIRQRLTSVAVQRDAALEGLERSATAMIVADRSGRLLYASSAAEVLLRTGDGLGATRARVFANDRLCGQRLSSMIREAADTAANGGAGSGGVVAVPRSERLPLTVLVAPFRPARDGLGAPLPAAILFIRDPENPTARSLALQGLFGLTVAEAKVASILAEGRSMEEIVDAFHISRNTVRTHLKSIFAKTNTTRQAQLVALLLQSVAVLASS
ncbi:MAG TPA: helix-turn-helix transcriptional regulator [Xanthobacteraceae bacterium]|nr:helix-turn-helix transcriptional regulator [Xanthobacteraceae bacterium]